jgi:hypothetical protein
MHTFQTNCWVFLDRYVQLTCANDWYHKFYHRLCIGNPLILFKNVGFIKTPVTQPSVAFITRSIVNFTCLKLRLTTIYSSLTLKPFFYSSFKLNTLTQRFGTHLTSLSVPVNFSPSFWVTLHFKFPILVTFIESPFPILIYSSISLTSVHPSTVQQ